MSEGCTAERRSMQAKEQLWLKNKAASTAVNWFGQKMRRRWVSRKACQGELWGQRNLTISDGGLKRLWKWFYGAEPMIAEGWIYVSAGLIYFFCSQFPSQIPDPAPLHWMKDLPTGSAQLLQNTCAFCRARERNSWIIKYWLLCAFHFHFFH